MQGFKLFLEAEKAPFVYHVTYMRNIPGIMSTKLIPAGGFSPYVPQQGRNIKDNSKKGVYFSSSLRDTFEWIQGMMCQSDRFHKTEKDVIPVILRFKLNRNSWEKDDIVTIGVRGSFYTKRTIDPLGLELWDGKKWTKNPNDVNNLRHYNMQEDMYGEYNYPKPPL